MNCYDKEIIPPPCPNCGKERGGVMSSSRWSHSITCCSDKCGEEIGKKLSELHNTKRWKNAVKQIEQGYDIMDRLEMELIGQTDKFRRRGMW